uniref:Uncharacterized protein n=1 Tax=Rhizoctonia solani TaxID=456999 RepID=N0A363_9AGAM|nr:hypothetical protein RSOL_m00580 [Rhizoctonia solani]AGK45391.1 hypothetical protein RSOL_m00580 [Rhizoctonia solani]
MDLTPAAYLYGHSTSTSYEWNPVRLIIIFKRSSRCWLKIFIREINCPVQAKNFYMGNRLPGAGAAGDPDKLFFMGN